MAEIPQAGLAFAAPARLSDWNPEQWPLAPGWRSEVDAFLQSREGQRLAEFMRARLAAGALVYPPQPFRALELTPLDTVDTPELL